MPVCIIGRSSSHFTRVARIFAEELGLAYELQPILDMSAMDPEDYGGNPALKLPTLRIDDRSIFGMQNACRAMARLGPAGRRIVWPEDVQGDDLLANAQELVLHSMAAQVQLVLGTTVAKLPADNFFFSKIRTGFENSLEWLDRRLLHVLQALPRRDLSFLETTLFCLLDHLEFRETLLLQPYPNLGRFRDQFAERPSARRTAYRFDAPPAS